MVVAATALANDAILVAIDKDMKQIAQRYGMTPRNTRFERLSLIQICCDEIFSLQTDRTRNVVSRA